MLFIILLVHTACIEIITHNLPVIVRSRVISVNILDTFQVTVRSPTLTSSCWLMIFKVFINININVSNKYKH